MKSTQAKYFSLGLALILSSAVASKVQAQTAVQAWAQIYSAPANNYYTGQKLVVDPSGNVIVAGTGSDESGGDWLVIKYTGAGVALWTNRYNGPGQSGANALAVDGSGNIFVTGNATTKYSSSGAVLWTIGRGGAAMAVDGSGNVVLTDFFFRTTKYSSAGVPLWTNRYSVMGSDFDQSVAVAVDGGGNVFVTGYSEFGGGASDDLATVAYSSAGVPLWTNRFNNTGSGYSIPNALAVDGSGNVFVTGEVDDADGIDSDFATVAYSGAGLPLWTNLYHDTGPIYSGAIAAVVDSSHNVIVTGSTSNGTNQDYTTIKYSNAGVPVWTNRYAGPGGTYDIAAGLAVDGSDNVFVTGYSYHDDGSEDFATVAYSGPGVALWTNVYDGPVPSYDTQIAVAVDTNGNVFVTGNSAGSFATISYSGVGVSIWTNSYNDLLGNSVDNAAAVIVDGGGNVFVTGSSIGIGSVYDFVTIKYSSAGMPLWTNRYNGPGNGSDVPFVMAADSAGNVIVAGYSWNGTNFDYLTIKYSSAGAALWTNSYNGPGNSTDYAEALAVDGSDNVLVAGSSAGSGSGYDYATIKYSSAGAPLWTNRYNGPLNRDDYANALAVDASGNVFVTGSATVSTNGDSDYATIKYSAAGVPLWTNRYNGPANGDDQAVAAGVDGSGNVFVTGLSIGTIQSNGYDSDYATIKYSSAGALLWTRRYAGPYFIDIASTLAVDGGGNVIVTGDSLDPSGSFTFTTIKYSGAGAVLWTQRYNDPDIGDGIATSIAVDAGGNVFISGSSYGPDSALDYATIAYSSAGVLLWTNRYNGPGNRNDVTGVTIRNNIVNPLKTRQALALGHDGSVYVTGTSEISNHGSASDFATVKYVVPPRLTGPGLANGQFAFTVSGSSGASVEIQASTNLQSWLPLMTNTLVGGTNFFSDPQSANAKAGFYRALLLP
jgi:hypothetical protein